MIYELLPLLRGWMYVYKEKTGTLTLGKEEAVDVVEAPGFLLSASAILSGSLDAKYVRVYVEFDGPERAFPIDFTPYGMYLFGLSYPLNYGAFLTRYDDTEKAYVGVISPSKPMSFAKRFEVKLIPPTAPVEETTALPITYKAVYVLVKIINMAEFKASLAEIFAPPVRRL